MDLLDTILDSNGELAVVDSQGHLSTKIASSLQVIPYEEDKAHIIIELLSQGMSVKKILRELSLTQASLNNWRKHYTEFNEAYKTALDMREDSLLELSYEENVLASYDKGEDSEAIKLKKVRAEIAHAHLKHASPHKFRKDGLSLTNQSVVFNLHMAEGGSLEKVKRYTPNLMPDGNLKVV